MKTVSRILSATTGWRRRPAEPEALPKPKRTSKQLRAEAGLLRTAAAGTMGALSVHSVEEKRALKARYEASAARLEAEADQAEREGR